MTQSKDTEGATRNTKLRVSLATLASAQPSILYLRDGDVVLYRRSRSLLYQCRYRLADGTWHRVSTRKASVEHAVAVACDLYDEARYRQRLGLAHRAHTFAQIAAITAAELRRKIDASSGKTSNHDYLSCIERYFVPYFGERHIEQLTNSDIVQFELWRDRQMQRKPKASTLNNFTSAWNKIIDTAVAQGFISERVPVPKLTARGEKGRTRPAFTEQELEQLFAFMDTWQTKGKFAVEKEIRPLLRDYIDCHSPKGSYQSLFKLAAVPGVKTRPSGPVHSFPCC
jgi:hypothetical protein